MSGLGLGIGFIAGGAEGTIKLIPMAPLDFSDPLMSGYIVIISAFA